MATSCLKKKSQMAADAASWYCVVFVVALVLLNASLEGDLYDDGAETNHVKGDEDDSDHLLIGRACDEIYVVGEGETLHTISDKCKDPYIIEQNPHIQDPDDVFPGLVIKITPTKLH